MDPRISIITLGVADLERLLLSIMPDWVSPPIIKRGKESHSSSWLALGWLFIHPTALAQDACLPPERNRFGGFTLAHNVSSKQKVDQVIGQALASGATLLKPAADTFWGGYSGYFSDPDGHPWEVAWNPFFLWSEIHE